MTIEAAVAATADSVFGIKKKQDAALCRDNAKSKFMIANMSVDCATAYLCQHNNYNHMQDDIATKIFLIEVSQLRRNGRKSTTT